MSQADPRRAPAKSRRPPRPLRGDVQALLALLTLDESVARLRSREAPGSNGEQTERLRRSLLDGERHAARLMRLAEKKQGEAAAASAALRETCDGLAARREEITGRIPREALDVYEGALRRGLLPAAIATRGAVCWGCFHRLSAPVATPFLEEEVFLCCPHCERLLFNPDWTART